MKSLDEYVKDKEIDDKMTTMSDVVGRMNIMPHLKGICYFSRENIEAGNSGNPEDSVCYKHDHKPLVQGAMAEYHQGCLDHFSNLHDIELKKRDKEIHDFYNSVATRFIGLPAFWKDFHEYPDHEEAKKILQILAVEKWLKSSKLGLIICGPTGRLKTFSAVYAAREWLKKHPYKEALFVEWDEYQSLLSQTYGQAATKTQYSLEIKLKKIPLLILDDVLGSEDVSKPQYMLFKRVIKFRNSATSKDGERFPTIITSNYTLDQIKTMEEKKNQGDSPLSSRVETFVQLQLYGTDLPNFRKAS